jgi:hypothetical protein
MSPRETVPATSPAFAARVSSAAGLFSAARAGLQAARRGESAHESIGGGSRSTLAGCSVIRQSRGGRLTQDGRACTAHCSGRAATQPASYGARSDISIAPSRRACSDTSTIDNASAPGTAWPSDLSAARLSRSRLQSCHWRRCSASLPTRLRGSLAALAGCWTPQRDRSARINVRKLSTAAEGHEACFTGSGLRSRRVRPRALATHFIGSVETAIPLPATGSDGKALTNTGEQLDQQRRPLQPPPLSSLPPGWAHFKYSTCT